MINVIGRHSASQRPANFSCTDGARFDLEVGMLQVMSLWYVRAPVNSARGGAGARDLVLCMIGSRGERLGSMATLGGGENTHGGGESAKVIRRGMTRNGRGDG